MTAAAGRLVGQNEEVESIQREFVAMPGGALRRVYSIDQADGTVALGDHQAWLASRAARCTCGKICRGSGRTCGAPECIARL
jgi:hypothetical protein